MARYKKHVVRYGETIQSIAALEMGDVSYWFDIVKSNNLVYPYIVETDKEKITNVEHLVTIGDWLVIPVEVTLDTSMLDKMPVQDKETVTKLALGQDLTMTNFPKYYEDKGTHDGILQLDANGKGDIATVYGVANLKQAIIAKLLTPKGSLILHPEYGSNLDNMFVKGSLETVNMIDDEISRTILTDGRISSCSKTSSTLSPMAYASNWEVAIEDIDTQMEFVISRDETGNFAII